MKENREILAIVAECQRTNTPFVLAKVIATEGSTYRKPGACAVFLSDGSCYGLISGGCLEQDISSHCIDILSRESESILNDDAKVPTVSKVLRYDTGSAKDIVMGLGLGCEGAVEVSLSLVTSQQAQWVCDQFPKPLQVLICGAGEDSKPIAELCSYFGYETIVLDRREGVLACFPNFANLSKIVWSAESILPSSEVILVLNHHYETDKVQIKQILDRYDLELDNMVHKPLVYCGVLGPRARTLRILQELCRSEAATLEWLFFPMGLDLGGDSPSSIALGTLSEIQATIFGRKALSLRGKMGSIHE